MTPPHLHARLSQCTVKAPRFSRAPGLHVLWALTFGPPDVSEASVGLIARSQRRLGVRFARGHCPRICGSLRRPEVKFGANKHAVATADCRLAVNQFGLFKWERPVSCACSSSCRVQIQASCANASQLGFPSLFGEYGATKSMGLS